MKKIYSFLIMLATILVMMSCGGDDASSAGGGGGEPPIGSSSVGAWYVQSGSYMLVWDFADNGAVTLHLYEISGDVYYKTQASGRYTKKDNTINFTIGGDASSATIIDNVMHLNDPDLGSLQLTKVNSSIQSSINTMENYFDNLQRQVVNEWYGEIDATSYEIVNFESSGKGTVTYYIGKESISTSFTWTRGGSISMAANGTTNTYKFNLKGGVLKIIDDNDTFTYQPMTDEIRQKIEDLQKAPTLQNGVYVEKNPDMKEWFMVEIDGNEMEEFVVTYGKKRKMIEGTFSINGNWLTIEGADINGDGIVNDDDKVNIVIIGDEITVGEITFVRSEITREKLIGQWQSTRTIGAIYDNGTVMNEWDWTLTGVSTGDGNKDNENIRMLLNNDGTFQSWTLLYGEWTKVQQGTFSFEGRAITTSFVDNGKNYSETWNVVCSTDSGIIIELWDGNDVYLSYYMKKI
ncbi:MAG: hypothetical protein IJ190_08200 [Prevotella sp.]|nr:hypothetical protein [Prevotella sp.]